MLLNVNDINRAPSLRTFGAISKLTVGLYKLIDVV